MKIYKLKLLQHLNHQLQNHQVHNHVYNYLFFLNYLNLHLLHLIHLNYHRYFLQMNLLFDYHLNLRRSK